MAIWLYVFPTQAGCVERLVVSSPYTRQVRMQNGQVMIQPDPESTLAWMRSFQYPFPQGVNPKVFALSPKTANAQQPDLLCIQIAEPTISRQMVNSGMPYGPPVGNPGAPIAPPPQAAPPPPQGQVMVPSGLYEQLPDVALPGGADGMFEMGEAGGTYTDITGSGQGAVEEVRPQNLIRQAPPPIQQQR